MGVPLFFSRWGTRIADTGRVPERGIYDRQDLYRPDPHVELLVFGSAEIDHEATSVTLRNWTGPASLGSSIPRVRSQEVRSVQLGAQAPERTRPAARAPGRVWADGQSPASFDLFPQATASATGQHRIHLRCRLPVGLGELMRTVDRIAQDERPIPAARNHVDGVARRVTRSGESGDAANNGALPIEERHATLFPQSDQGISDPGGESRTIAFDDEVHPVRCAHVVLRVDEGGSMSRGGYPTRVVRMEVADRHVADVGGGRADPVELPEELAASEEFDLVSSGPMPASMRSASSPGR